MRGLDVNAVVPDKARKWKGAALSGADQRECERRFAGARRAADQHRARADQHRGRVDGGSRHCAARGRRTSSAAVKYAIRMIKTAITAKCVISPTREFDRTGASRRNTSTRRNTSFTPPPISM